MILSAGLRDKYVPHNQWCLRPVLIYNRSGPVADTAYVKTITAEIVFCVTFAGLFADTIHGIRVHYAVLGCINTWRVWAEYSNRAWPVYPGYFKIDGGIQYME